MLGVAWPSMRGSLDAPVAGLGLLVAAITVAQFVASGASGLLRERLGTVALLLAAVAAAAAGLATFAAATGWWATILAAGLLGAGVGLLDAAVNTEAALRGDVRFMGALHGAWAVGASLGPPLVGAALATSGSWRAAYVVAGLAFALLGCAAFATRSDLAAAPERETDAPESASLRRAVAIGCVLMFVYVGIELGAGQWSYTRFTTTAAIDDATAGFAVFLFWLALAGGRVLLAVFGDRVAAARLFDWSVFGALAGTLAFWILPPALAALIALPAIGATLSVFVPLLIYLLPSRIGSAAAPRAIGYLVAAGMVGGAVLPGVIGLVMQTFDVSALGACLSLLALVQAGLHLFSTGRVGVLAPARSS